jgi:hypothetical protein
MFSDLSIVAKVLASWKLASNCLNVMHHAQRAWKGIQLGDLALRET